MPGLERASREKMKGAPILLNQEQANALLAQLLETAGFRGWHILAVAVLINHVHAVLGVRGDPDPDKLLGDLKAYGSRCLNREWGKPTNGTWWADKGSTRKLPNDASVQGAVIYVATQPGALSVYVAQDWREFVAWAAAHDQP